MSDPDPATPSRQKDEAWAAKQLRREWFLGHGCGFHALYGDDGEMQCHACHVDFLREPLDELHEFVGRKRMERTVVAMDAAKVVPPVAPAGAAVSQPLRFGIYRKVEGRTGVGMLYQFLLLARGHTTGEHAVVYVPLRIDPVWTGTIRCCYMPRAAFERKFEFIGEALP